MKMIYESGFGRIELCGAGEAGFCILDVDGMGVLGRERSLIKFAGRDGCSESSASFAQRVITVSGDISRSEPGAAREAMRVFSLPGTLTVVTDGAERCILVNDAVFNMSEKNGRFKGFCVQMTCDNPHFTDCRDIEREVYSREKLITSETVLPAMFTKRSFGGNVRNDGEVRSEPIITIKGTADAAENGTIKIENKTAKKSIVLNHSLSKGEVIVLNIPDRTVLSSTAGDILNTLDADSYLYDIYLDCGDNDIDVITSEENRSCEIYVTYRNLYTGMVI